MYRFRLLLRMLIFNVWFVLRLKVWAINKIVVGLIIRDYLNQDEYKICKQIIKDQ